MTIWTTSSEAANSTPSGISIRRTRATTIVLSANGLKPTSKYTLWCNGVDMSWACKTHGTRMGDPLISDEKGNLTVQFMCEVDPATSTTTIANRSHTIVLKDILGGVKSTTVIQQSLTGR